MSRTYILLNPASGNGAAGRRWARLARLAADIFGDPTVVASGASGQLRAAAREIARSRRPVTILAAGGDGTSHEVLNGIVAAATPRSVLMGWIPIGSGNDLARAAGVPLALEQMLPGYRRASQTVIDIGRVEYRDASGAPAQIAFGNSFTLGLSVAVLERVERSGRPFGGRLDYLAGTLRALVSPERTTWPVIINGEPTRSGPRRLLAVTNGPTIGAGMRIAPSANLNDGRFECTSVSDVSTATALSILVDLYRGRHLAHPAVRQEALTRLEIEGDAPIAFEADGELIRGHLPLVLRVERGRLPIIRPAPPLGG